MFRVTISSDTNLGIWAAAIKNRVGVPVEAKFI